MRYKTETGEITLVLEVKGYESEQDRQKKTAAERWVMAVNYHGGFGSWKLLVCRDPRRLDKVLKTY